MNLEDARARLYEHYGYFDQSWESLLKSYNATFESYIGFSWLIRVLERETKVMRWKQLPDSIVSHVESFELELWESKSGFVGTSNPFYELLGPKKYKMYVEIDQSGNRYLCVGDDKIVRLLLWRARNSTIDSMNARNSTIIR